MKKLLLLALALMFFCNAFAQITRIIKRDTINIRGYIYDSSGRPVIRQNIFSRTKESKYDRYPNGSTTDSTGYFYIEAAKFNDTLSIEDAAYGSLMYFNKGSRYMVIYLPSPKIQDINSQNPIMITAARRHPRKIASLKIEDFDGCILFGFSINAEPPGGMPKLIKYLNARIRYPENAIEHNIEGEVKIAITIEKDGSVINPRVLQGIGYNCDQQIISVLKNSPKWRPALNSGRAIQQSFVITAQFKLVDK